MSVIMNLHTSTGVLRYSNDEGYYRLVVNIDPEISKYYYSLIPKWFDTNRPRWAPHVTVVRPIKEIPTIFDAWGKYEGELVNFQYDGSVYYGKVYFWINVFCKRLEEIRTELGLEVSSPYTRPPEGYKKCFHSTIANMKDL